MKKMPAREKTGIIYPEGMLLIHHNPFIFLGGIILSDVYAGDREDPVELSTLQDVWGEGEIFQGTGVVSFSSDNP